MFNNNKIPRNLHLRAKKSNRINYWLLALETISQKGLETHKIRKKEEGRGGKRREEIMKYSSDSFFVRSYWLFDWKIKIKWETVKKFNNNENKKRDFVLFC